MSLEQIQDQLKRLCMNDLIALQEAIDVEILLRKGIDA